MKNLPRILLVLSVLFFNIVPLHAKDTVFKVQVFPDQTSVKAGMMFLVNVQLLNPNEGSVDLWCHTCSYEKHWITDTPSVVVQPWTCHDDSVGKVTVEGGTTLERNLILYIPNSDKSGPVTFRLGFKHMLENGDEMEPVWSDPVTIRVLVPEGAASDQKSPGETTVKQQVVRDQPPEVEISDSMPDEASGPDSDVDPDVDPDVAAKIP